MEDAVRVDLMRIGRGMHELGLGITWTDLRALIGAWVQDTGSRTWAALTKIKAAEQEHRQEPVEGDKPQRPKYTAAQIRAAIAADEQ